MARADFGLKSDPVEGEFYYFLKGDSRCFHDIIRGPGSGTKFHAKMCTGEKNRFFCTWIQEQFQDHISTYCSRLL